MRPHKLKGPAHSARHRIPKGRKSAKLVLVTRPGAAGVERARTDAYSQKREEALYKAMMARATEKQTDARDYHEDEDGRGIWVPETWVAVEYARCCLAVEIFSWAEEGGAKILGLKRSKREDALKAAIAVLKCIRDNLTADNLPLIEGLLRHAIPALEQAKRANQHGGHTDLHFPRYQLIARTVDIICRRYGCRPTPAFSIVAEALRREKAIPTSKESVGRIWRNWRTTFENRVN